MIIIAAKNAFIEKRTGVEEYTYQLLKYFNRIDEDERRIVYTNKKGEELKDELKLNMKILRLPILWTQIGLSLVILKRLIFLKSESLKLFIPGHVMPPIHPKKTIITIHGLEYEYFPEHYSLISRSYLRYSTKYAVKHAWKIITVSHNTKKDLVKIYKADPRKITVIYHGRQKPETEKETSTEKYFVYLGRIELKKNILGIIKAFKYFKKKYKKNSKNFKLILIGSNGYGFKKIREEIKKTGLIEDLIMLGYIKEELKKRILKKAWALIFPSFYEGFGLPIIEAQSMGIPVITSRGSSTEEISNKSTLLVDPKNFKEIGKAMNRLVVDDDLRQEMIKKGYKNVEKFSWDKCARETHSVISN